MESVKLPSIKSLRVGAERWTFFARAETSDKDQRGDKKRDLKIYLLIYWQVPTVFWVPDNSDRSASFQSMSHVKM